MLQLVKLWKQKSIMKIQYQKIKLTGHQYMEKQVSGKYQFIFTANDLGGIIIEFLVDENGQATLVE